MLYILLLLEVHTISFLHPYAKRSMGNNIVKNTRIKSYGICNLQLTIYRSNTFAFQHSMNQTSRRILCQMLNYSNISNRYQNHLVDWKCHFTTEKGIKAVALSESISRSQFLLLPSTTTITTI